MSLRSLAFIVFPVLLLGACQSSRPSNPEIEQGRHYDEALAMSYMLTDPRYSMELIDSAYWAKNINDEERQYLKAIVMYNGFSRPDSSLLMCRHLVESTHWEKVEDTVLMVNVYSLMATVAGTLNRHADVIHYAQVASELTYGHPNLRLDESDLLSRVGRTMAFLGQKEEGLQLITRAYEEVGNSKSWPTLMTSVNIGRKLADTQIEMNQSEDALQTFRVLVEKLDYFRTHSQEFADLQASMQQSDEAVEAYVNYMRVRCYAGMIRCFASLEVPDSALYWMEVMDNYKESYDPLILINLIPSLVELHFDDIVLEDVDELFNTLGADTLNLEYVHLLEAMSELERHRNNWKAASNCLVRASAVRDSVVQESFRSQLTDQLTIYQLHDERTNRIEAERKNRQLFYVIASLVILLLLSAALVIIMMIANRLKALKRVHNDTKSELNEAKLKIEKLSKGYVPETPEQLYQRIMNVMEAKHPYTNQDFDIVLLASMVNSNRTYVSKVINKQTGMNFRTWLAKYRINMVQNYLKENPEASLDELCIIAGYASRSSLFRHFKSITGDTPISWLSSQEEET